MWAPEEADRSHTQAVDDGSKKGREKGKESAAKLTRRVGWARRAVHVCTHASHAGACRSASLAGTRLGGIGEDRGMGTYAAPCERVHGPPWIHGWMDVQPSRCEADGQAGSCMLRYEDRLGRQFHEGRASCSALQCLWAVSPTSSYDTVPAVFRAWSSKITRCK